MVSTHSGVHSPYNLLESGEAFFDLPCLMTFSALLLARGSFMEEVSIPLALKHGGGRCLVKSVLRIKHGGGRCLVKSVLRIKHRKPSPKRGRVRIF